MLFWGDHGALGGGNDRNRVFCAEGFLDFFNRSGFAEGEACRICRTKEYVYISDHGALGGGNDRNRVFCAEGFLDFFNRSGFAEGEACRICRTKEYVYIRENGSDTFPCLCSAPEVCTIVWK